MTSTGCDSIFDEISLTFGEFKGISSVVEVENEVALASSSGVSVVDFVNLRLVNRLAVVDDNVVVVESSST